MNRRGRAAPGWLPASGRLCAWSDTGIGISPQDLAHVFERFYRVSAQGNIPGTGLGLSIARELVELHDGHITATSTLGQGSIFAIYLPLSEEINGHRQAQLILVVDDQPDLLENIGLALESAGYQVLTAGDGVEALAVLQSQPVDLILADIAMPRMNGYQLYERVRENVQWVAIPFLFLDRPRNG